MKSICLLSRRPDLSRADFRDYYETRHSLLGIRYFPFRRYVRNHIIEASLDVDFDCLSEFDVDDVDHSQQVMASSIGDLFREDESRFMDRSLIRSAMATESLVDGPERCVDRSIARKQILLLHKPAGIDVEDFAEATRSWGVELGRGSPDVSRVTLDLVDAYPGAPRFPYDALLSLWLTDGSAGVDAGRSAISILVDAYETPPEVMAKHYDPRL